MNPEQCDADTLTRHILSVVDPLIGNFPNKLISKSYDGAAVMSGHNVGVQANIKQRYPFAHYVHCYAHQLNLIILYTVKINDSTSKSPCIYLKDIPGFFNNSPQRVEVLNRIVGKNSTRSNNSLEF
ncbi:unnamed protein product [Acanthoscelides obtectus]|uniref:DUF4371 domain-containing protein n=1 Tax=Acanthoscelides obtectus TaxID=200917 RepID=A0A9P0KG10_ACAOB|nr:unnamed protein product [Acanthoscelides obtectus]CAK1626349.1 hypothetical protein AOBTE_LOCUS3795 [Acanthoscelides obtectus]